MRIAAAPIRRSTSPRPASGAGLAWSRGHGAGRRRRRRPLLRGAARARRRDARCSWPPTRSGPARRSSRDDFRTARVTLTPEVLATVAQADDRRRFEGRIAGTTIAAGELVTSRTPATARGTARPAGDEHPDRSRRGRSAVGSPPAIASTCSSPVSTRCRSSSPTREVLAVDARGRGGIGESSSPFTVTIAVDARGSRSWSRRRSPTARSRWRARRAPTRRAAPHPQSLDRVDDDDGRATGSSAPEPTVALVFSPELWVGGAAPSPLPPRRRAGAPDRGRALGRARGGRTTCSS